MWIPKWKNNHVWQAEGSLGLAACSQWIPSLVTTISEQTRIMFMQIAQECYCQAPYKSDWEQLN